MPSYVLITPPTQEPVTLAETKLQVRATSSVEDSVLARAIKAATQLCEQKLGRALCTQTWQAVLDKFPETIDIELLWPKVQSISSIKFYDANGALQTLNTADYELDNASEPCFVRPMPDKAWPETLTRINAVKVQYVSGYGDMADVPEAIKQWILAMVDAMYDNRSIFSAQPGVSNAVNLGQYYDRLLDRYKVHPYA